MELRSEWEVRKFTAGMQVHIKGKDATSDELGVKKVLQWVTKHTSRQAIVFEILTISAELIRGFFALMET